MRLTAFNARALTDVAAAVKSLEGQGAVELVLDLRDNRGGLVQEGIEIAKLFLEGELPLALGKSLLVPGSPSEARHSSASSQPSHLAAK